MKNVKKVFLFSAILPCVVFLGIKFYDGYASMNTEGDYMLKGESNTYYEAISFNSNHNNSDYTLKGEPNTYYELITPNANGSSDYALKGESNIHREIISINTSSDYTLKGELNIYHETFPPISKDIDSNAIDGMYSGNLVIAEPTLLPEQ